MLARPETPRTPLVTKIRYSTSCVTALLPEKDEAFRQLVRALDYHWTGSTWQREMDRYSGQSIDRAAELGRRLIQAGFSVEFPDEQVMRMAIDGSYTPEQRRWVMAKVAGDFAGWFYVWWRRSENLYQEAMHIPGARYNPPGIVVPAGRYEEVLDFAEINHCQLSDGAKRLVEEAKARMREALVCNLVDAPKKEAPKAPEKYEVANELLDEPL